MMRETGKTTQTWCTFPANRSDMARKSGSIRVLVKLTSDSKVTSRKARLKSAKNLYFGYRFFDEIRQIHRIFDVFRQKLQILLRSQARNSWHCCGCTPIGFATLQLPLVNSAFSGRQRPSWRTSRSRGNRPPRR